MSRLAKRVFFLYKSSSSSAAAAAASPPSSSSSSSSWRFLAHHHHHVRDTEIGMRCFSSSSAGYHVSPSSSMKGAVFWDPTRPLSLELLQIPRPQPGELLIRTKACGVCRSDLHVLKGLFPFVSPCVVGHEITGEVVDHHPLTDPKIVHKFPVGSLVVGAFSMPCGSCFHCSKGHDDLCEDFFSYNRGKGTLYDGKTRLFLHGTGKFFSTLISSPPLPKPYPFLLMLFHVQMVARISLISKGAHDNTSKLISASEVYLK